MINFILSFFRKDLESILSTFFKAVKDLEAHAEAKTAEAMAHVDAASLSTKLADEAMTIQAKARATAEQLRALLD